MGSLQGISTLTGVSTIRGLSSIPVKPLFISYTEITSGWGTNTAPRSTASITVNNGDILIAIGAIEGQGSPGADTLGVAGGGLVWNEEKHVDVGSYVVEHVWSTTATSTTSFAVTFSRAVLSNSSLWWGGGVIVFRNSNGIGASAKTNVLSGAPSLNLITTQPNSAIICLSGDWTAADGTSRTWLTINGITPTSGNGLEKVYFRDASHYVVYSAYWDDVGAIGTKTTGLSAPGSQKYSIIAIEIKGT